MVMLCVISVSPAGIVSGNGPGMKSEFSLAVAAIVSNLKLVSVLRVPSRRSVNTTSLSVFSLTVTAPPGAKVSVMTGVALTSSDDAPFTVPATARTWKLYCVPLPE